MKQCVRRVELRSQDTPVHIRYVIPPVTAAQLESIGIYSPRLQVEMFERGEPPTTADVVDACESVRESFSHPRHSPPRIHRVPENRSDQQSAAPQPTAPDRHVGARRPVRYQRRPRVNQCRVDVGRLDQG
jgi:hypothetical protein